MGFLKRNMELEGLFDEKGLSWEFLTDKEYRQLIVNWRNIFEESLNQKLSIERGNANDSIEAKIPFKSYIFNAPNYKQLLQIFGAYSNSIAYGYKVDYLNPIPPFILKKNNSIICDLDFNYMCAYHLELPEVYCEPS